MKVEYVPDIDPAPDTFPVKTHVVFVREYSKKEIGTLWIEKDGSYSILFSPFDFFKAKGYLNGSDEINAEDIDLLELKLRIILKKVINDKKNI